MSFCCSLYDPRDLQGATTNAIPPLDISKGQQIHRNLSKSSRAETKIYLATRICEPPLIAALKRRKEWDISLRTRKAYCAGVVTTGQRIEQDVELCHACGQRISKTPQNDRDGQAVDAQAATQQRVRSSLNARVGKTSVGNTETSAIENSDITVTKRFNFDSCMKRFRTLRQQDASDCMLTDAKLCNEDGEWVHSTDRVLIDTGAVRTLISESVAEFGRFEQPTEEQWEELAASLREVCSMTSQPMKFLGVCTIRVVLSETGEQLACEAHIVPDIQMSGMDLVIGRDVLAHNGLLSSSLAQICRTMPRSSVLD